MLTKTLKFRTRLLFSFLAVFIPLVLLGSCFAYYRIKTSLETRIERELQKNADALADQIRISVTLSIKASLKSIASKNEELAEYYYNKYRSGLISQTRAMEILKEIFLNQAIGDTGYIYCLNSRGDILIHPDDQIEGTNRFNSDCIQKQVTLKKGYLEYEHQGQGDNRKRAKAVYMSYYEPLDWIICASAYQDEFRNLVDMDQIRRNILVFQNKNRGNAFILDENGSALISPDLPGKNLMGQEFSSGTIIREMLKMKEGMLRYQWQNTHEGAPRDKIVLFKYLPKLRWTVASTNYAAEVFSPLTTFTRWVTGGMIVFLLVFTAITYLISKSVTRPLEILAGNLEAAARGDYSVRMVPQSAKEIHTLSHHFNTFMDRLENYHDKLNREIQKTVATQAALVENELKLRGLFNQSFQHTCILSPYGILEEVNKSALEFAGCTEADVLYRPYWETPWWCHDEKARTQIHHAIDQALTGKLVRLETTHMCTGGSLRDIDMSVKPIFNNSGKVEFIITEGRDVTDLKQAEREKSRMAVQLEKSQKMEAIGTLAGGIAHDFNNILSSIFGYTQLAEMTLDTPEKAQKHISQIIKGAQRASSLVQQILTFSRQTEYKKQHLKLYLVVKEALKLLRSSIPSTIEIVTEISSKDMVNADPTQMHQVIMNLCTNAYHSMLKNGGTLTVVLEQVQRVPDHHNPEGRVCPAGPLLKLLVRDTGHGMDSQVLSKAFDPYFTTKELGRGTGFGLALVHAIVDEHQGVIHAESQVGVGSSFYVYLPIEGAPQNFDLMRETDPPPKGGHETILVADDEADIRDLSRELLGTYGYRVVTCRNGQEALSLFDETPEKFDLVITDMTMPVMTGAALAKELLARRKDLPVILCTGYSETISKQDAELMGITIYLQKPIKNRTLLTEVRNILDRKK